MIRIAAAAAVLVSILTASSAERPAPTCSVTAEGGSNHGTAALGASTAVNTSWDAEVTCAAAWHGWCASRVEAFNREARRTIAGTHVGLWRGRQWRAFARGMRAQGCVRREWLVPSHPDAWHGLGTAGYAATWGRQRWRRPERAEMIRGEDREDAEGEDGGDAPADGVDVVDADADTCDAFEPVTVTLAVPSEAVAPAGGLENGTLRWMCEDFIRRGEVSSTDGRPPLPLNLFCHLPHPDSAAAVADEDDFLGGDGGDARRRAREGEEEDAPEDGHAPWPRRAGGGTRPSRGPRPSASNLAGRPTTRRPSLPLPALASLRVRVMGETTLLAAAPRVSVRAMGGGVFAVTFRPLERTNHELRAWVQTASRAATRLDPRLGENERWMPDYVGFRLDPVRVPAEDIRRKTDRGKSEAETSSGEASRELPLCGGTTPGAWWGGTDAVRIAGDLAGSACHGEPVMGRQHPDVGEGERRKTFAGLFDEGARTGPLLDGAVDVPPGEGADSRWAALTWRPTEPCRECRVRRRSSALRCLRRRPLVMLGDSVMLQQCSQLKVALARLEEQTPHTPSGERCDISARMEEDKNGVHPKEECSFTGEAANVMCVDLSEAGGNGRQLGTLDEALAQKGEEGMKERLKLLREMLLTRASEGDPEGIHARGGADVEPVLVIMGGLHDVAYNNEETFRRALLPGAGVETFVRLARHVTGFSRVIVQLNYATNARVGKERTCGANPYQLPNDACFEARLSVITNAKVSSYNEMLLDFIARLSRRRENRSPPLLDIHGDVLDAYAISVGREDSATDPMHYCEPVYAAVNAALLSMVCDGAACDDDDAPHPGRKTAGEDNGEVRSARETIKTADERTGAHEDARVLGEASSKGGDMRTSHDESP